MPKELHEISKFMAGTVTVPSETDISDDTASYSLNIDPVAEDGILKGIPDDLLAIIKSGISSPAAADYANGVGTVLVDSSGSFAVTGYLYVEDDTGVAMILKYIGKSTNTFIGVTWLGPGAGNIDNNDAIFQVPLIVAHKMAMINDDGTHRVVYFDDNDDKIKKIDDIHGTVGTTATLSSSAEDKTGIPTMQTNNTEVHIGMGKGITNRARWCGIPQYKQFGVETTALTLENAELDTPSPFTDFTKVVTDGTFIYAFKRDDTYLYKFRISTGRLELRSGANWSSIKSICMHATDSNFLWVYDNDTSLTENYSLDKVDTNTFEIAEEYLFDACPEVTGGASPAAVDILHTVDNTSTYGYMWCFGYNSAHAAKGYHWELPAFGVAINTTAGNSHPSLNGGGSYDATGNAIWYDTGSTTWRNILYGGYTGGSFSFPTGAFLFKPTGGLQAKSYCGIYWIFRTEGAAGPAANDVYYVFALGGSSSAGAHAASRFKISTADDYAVPQGVIFRDDAPSGGVFASPEMTMFQIPFDNAKTDYGDNINANYADHRTMNGTNDDVTFVSARNKTDSDESDYFTFVNPAYNAAQGYSVTSISAITTDSELKHAVGVVDKDGSTVKVQMFEGEGATQGRWAYGTLASPSAVLESFVKLTPTGTNSGGTLDSGKTYYYKASFIYDGYQESPLTHQLLLEHDPGSGTTAKVKIVIDFKGINVLPKRVSHLNIYVAESDDAADEPEGFYRLLEHIPLDFGWATKADTTANTVFNSTYRQKEFMDIGKRTGPSYEAETGISEVVQDTMPNYTLSTQLNNQQFVADCYHPDLHTVPNYMFKSKSYNFDQFDWSVDLLRLPTKPTALASFNGRIYAFGENNTYRIEPQNFYIEDTFEGVGCVGPDAVVVTEYGMCFADNNNIYLHNGGQPVPIGDSILRGDDKSWQNRDKTWSSKVIFDAARNSFVVMFKYSGNYYSWVFNVARRRWDLWEIFGTTEPLGTLTGKNGEMFISDGTNLKHYLGHTSTRRNWDWYSKKLTMGTDTQTKVFKRTRVAGNTGDCIDTFVSSEGTPSNSGATDGTTGYIYTLSGPNSRAKWIQYKITAEANTVDAIGTIFRRRPIR